MIASPVHRALVAAGACVCLSMAVHSPAADAATQRTINLSATSVCEAPLPVFNVHLRKRPVAVQNESDRPVFVSCTLPTDSAGQSNTGSVRVSFATFGEAATISCTMVSGTRGAQVFYVPEERALAANGRVVMDWNDINKWSTSGTYAFSCNLPPGVVMETITYTQTDTGGRL
ncbi:MULTISPECIES: hypothetical protein [unclassified Luteimonas]